MTAGAAPLLRVLTLNCWLLRWGQLRVAHDLARRAAAIPEAVAATGADLVLLQEVWLPGLARGLAAGLERTGYRHLALGAPPTAARVFGDGLLVASRHPLSAPRRLAFSRRSVWYEHLIAKGALAVEVTPPGADPLCVATAHLAVVRYDVRRREFRRDDAATHGAQLAQLADWLGQAPPAAPLVLAGDLNLIDRPFAGGRYADADAHGYRALLDRLHLADAWREHDRRAAGFTFDPATNPYAARGRCRHIPGQRIDYVLYRPHAGLRCPQAALVFTEAPHLSDHYGVLADLLLPPKISASSAGGVTSSWS